ncbi:MAG: MBL fold metallo-hydrolase [Candidatus Odinarchaeota archaeon]
MKIIRYCMALRKLLDSIYVDTAATNGGNHGAIVLDDEILMVDSGMIHTKSRISKQFLESETGLSIKKIIFTHSHSDHVFGAQAFEPILLISSERMRMNCDDRLKHEWKHDNLLERYSYAIRDNPELWDAVQTLSIRLPDIVFKDEISLGNAKQVTAKLVGGHTSGSAIVVCHDSNTVFIGDLIFNGQFPYGGDPTCNPDRWISALEEIRDKQYEIIIPGHGPVCGQEELEDYIGSLTALRQNVKDAIVKGSSFDSFSSNVEIPDALKTGFELFGEVTLKHWFRYYS